MACKSIEHQLELFSKKIEHLENSVRTLSRNIDRLRAQMPIPNPTLGPPCGENILNADALDKLNELLKEEYDRS